MAAPMSTPGALRALPLVMLVCAGVYSAFGLYRGVWRFASLPDLVRITQATVAATLSVLLVLFVVNRMQDVPRSVPPLFLVFQLVLLAGPRLVYRWLKDHRLSLRPKVRVLVVGAERAGEMLVRDMLRDRAGAYLPVAFVDDQPRNLVSARESVADAHLFHLMADNSLRALIPPPPEGIVIVEDWREAQPRIAAALEV